ncbi:hypothetical protein H0H93_003225, partial [Arthromyces matolae]
PDLILPMIYAHLGLVYSLLLSALISLCTGQLTQNDGVFVLVTVASPASFALWGLTIWSLFDPGRFPVRKNGKKSKEIFLLKSALLFSLAFEIAMICIVFVPSSTFQFSQPACNQSYGDKLWIKLLWELPYIINFAWAAIVFAIFRRLFRPLLNPELEQSNVAPISSSNEAGASHPDILTVTEDMLVQHFQAPPTSCIVSLFRRIHISNDDKRPDSLRIDLADLENALSASRCGDRHIKDTQKKTDVRLIGPFNSCKIDFHSRYSFMFVLIGSLGFTTIASLIAPTNIEPTVSSKKLNLNTQALLLNMYTAPVWVFAWLATSISSNTRPSAEKIWRQIMRRAHILKAFLLVITPNALWIQSSVASNPTTSTEMTFGQIFALIVSAVTITSLLDAAKDIDKATCVAIILSRPLDDEVAAASTSLDTLPKTTSPLNPPSKSSLEMPQPPSIHSVHA